MKGFDVQTVSIEAPLGSVFDFVAAPENLPEWTAAFRFARSRRAVLETPQGSVEIDLEVVASRQHGTVDWVMSFPDGSVARAFSRMVAVEQNRTIYTFVLTPPPVPLEQLEGALAEQSRTLSEELARLRALLSADDATTVSNA